MGISIDKESRIHFNQEEIRLPKRVMTVEEFIKFKEIEGGKKIIVRINGVSVLTKNRAFSFIKAGDQVEVTVL